MIRVLRRDFGRLRERYTPTQLVVGLALLLAGLSLTVVVIGDEGKLLDWLIQIGATFVAALLAFALGIQSYRLQEQEREENLEAKLERRVAAEVKMNWGILNNPRSSLRDAQGNEVGRATLIPLNTASIEDLIRNNTLDAQEALEWMQLEAHIKANNREVDALWALIGGTALRQSFAQMIRESNKRQDGLLKYFGEMLRDWEERGIEAPS